jgi:hypothetical protein
MKARWISYPSQQKERPMIGSTPLRLAHLLLLVTLAFGLSDLSRAQMMGVPQLPQIPAFLPSVESVAPTAPQPLDGTWLIPSIRKKIRIEGGRAYAVDGWLHMMVLKIEPGMVVIQDITPTAPGKYSGNDLPLLGSWEATVENDRSLAVTVKTALMPVPYKLVPMQLDNPGWYAQEMQAAGLTVPQSAYAPPQGGYQPAPPQYQAPPPAYQQQRYQQQPYQQPAYQQPNTQQPGYPPPNYQQPGYQQSAPPPPGYPPQGYPPQGYPPPAPNYPPQGLAPPPPQPGQVAAPPPSVYSPPAYASPPYTPPAPAQQAAASSAPITAGARSAGHAAHTMTKVAATASASTANLTGWALRSTEARNPIGHTVRTTQTRLCEDKGGAGEPPCEYVDAIDRGKSQFACKGKQLYLSDGNCYRCPDNYKRSNITRKMAGDPQACEKRGFNTKEYKPASLERDAFGCPGGQFTHKGRCKSCPANSKRVHIAGVDTGRCKVDKAHECIGDMRLAKQPPEGSLQKLGNLAGFKSEKICAPRFDIKAFAYEAVDDVGSPLFTAAKTLARRLKGNDADTKRKLDKMRDDIEHARLQEALDTLLSFDEFGLLVEAASAAHNFSISVGFTKDWSVGVGTNSEKGIAIDFAGDQIFQKKRYETKGFSKGLSAGVDFGLVVGLWGGTFESGPAQGIIVDIKGSEGGSAGVWTTYYSAEVGQERLLGFSVGVGVGFSLEVGEYNEVYTSVGG